METIEQALEKALENMLKKVLKKIDRLERDTNEAYQQKKQIEVELEAQREMILQRQTPQ